MIHERNATVCLVIESIIWELGWGLGVNSALRARTPLPEDPISAPSTSVRWLLTVRNSSSRGCKGCDLPGYLHYSTQTIQGNTAVNIIKINTFKNKAAWTRAFRWEPHTNWHELGLERGTLVTGTALWPFLLSNSRLGIWRFKNSTEIGLQNIIGLGTCSNNIT